MSSHYITLYTAGETRSSWHVLWWCCVGAAHFPQHTVSLRRDFLLSQIKRRREQRIFLDNIRLQSKLGGWEEQTEIQKIRVEMKRNRIREGVEVTGVTQLKVFMCPVFPRQQTVSGEPPPFPVLLSGLPLWCALECILSLSPSTSCGALYVTCLCPSTLTNASQPIRLTPSGCFSKAGQLM